MLTSGPVAITVTFSEPVAATPTLSLASTGGRLLGGALTRVTEGGGAAAEGRLYRFVLTVSTADNGTYTVSVQAADAAGNALAAQPAGNQLTVAIVPNRPPVASAGPDRSVSADQTARLEGSATDPDGDPVTFSWTAPVGVSLSSSTSLTPTFTPAVAGVYRFVLRVTDNRGAWSEDAVELTAGQVTAGLRTELLVVRGIARFESGELPPAGAKIRVTNPRTGASQLGEVDPESGSYRVTFTDAGGDAAAAGDTLTLQYLDPDGSSRALTRPSPPSLSLVDDAITLGAADLDLTAAGSATSGAVLATIAGNGTGGFAGDTGPATAALLNDPRGLALRGTQALLVADTRNNRVREVNLSTGTIRTVAGTGVAGYSGDGGPATQAKLFSPARLATSASPWESRTPRSTTPRRASS